MSLIETAAPDLDAPAQQHGQLRATPVLPEAVRLLATFAGLGAASVACGLSSNFIFAFPALGWPAYPAAALSGGWAVYLAVWSVRTMRGNKACAGWTTALLSATSLICLLAVVYSVWLTPEGSLDLTTVSLGALQLIMLCALGYLRRLADSPPDRAARPTPGRLLLALFAGAILVAAVTTPGLAATTAGDFAVPHGEHSDSGPDRADLAKLEHSGH